MASEPRKPAKAAAAKSPPTSSDAQRLATSLDRLTTELVDVDARRTAQIADLRKVVSGIARVLADLAKVLVGVRRTGRISVALMVGKLITLLFIVSALYPGVPVLRIHEKNERKTAEVIRNINCGVLWANGTRLSACNDVFAILDAQARSEGQPIPGVRS